MSAEVIAMRPAVVSDVEAIFAVLTEVAPEIPLRLDGDERQVNMRGIIRGCCPEELSTVVTLNGVVVGFLLARRTLTLLSPQEQIETIELTYGGVLKVQRTQHHFSPLLRRAKSFGVPLFAVVKDKNQGDMAARLEKAGFKRQATTQWNLKLAKAGLGPEPVDEVPLLWQPPLFTIATPMT